MRTVDLIIIYFCVCLVFRYSCNNLGLHFEKTGEFSKVTLQTRTGDGRNKDVGGDTWRMFVRGGDRVTPFISDLNNGVYEAQFIVFQPGLYKVEVVLESTLCEAFKDPPQDWLKRGKYDLKQTSPKKLGARLSNAVTVDSKK